ncbi:glycosyltransferase [Alcanivorax sp.]|jgi:glycosyltransferase involved in cell wall biosynthesis|uniref:glycosyltransferase n=1 Tax=Alcanivorax sp. TaxID=1872427 RepID=UPI0032D98D9E
MKVFNVFSTLDFGGVESMALILAENNIPKINVSFVAISRGGRVSESISQCGFDVHVLNVASKIPSVRAIMALYFLFKCERPDVVHCRGGEANFHGIIASWLAGVPVRVAEEIGIPSHGFIAKVIFKLIYKASNGVVAISDAVKRWIVASGESPENKIRRIYNPVEVRCSHGEARESKQKNKFRIGFVGRLEPVKNPIALLKAAIQLLRKGIDIELWIIGDGSLNEDIRSEIKKYGFADHIRLFGYVDQPMNLVSQCDLYVQPSISEGFGLAVVEAMLCSVPVLASSVGGVPEIIDDNLTGWLLSDTGPEFIASRIEFLAALPSSELQAVGQKGRASVENRFSPNTYINALYDFYLSVNDF